MARFTDDEKRDWLIHVDVNALRKVRDLFKINLGSFDEVGGCLARLADDPILLCDLLYVLCEEQVKERELTDADFGRLLLGDVIARATMALGEAIADFFPHEKRSLLQRLQKKIDRVQKTGADLIRAKLDDPKLEEQLAATMKARMDRGIEERMELFASVKSLPEKSEESTPAP